MNIMHWYNKMTLKNTMYNHNVSFTHIKCEILQYYQNAYDK